MGGGGDYYSSSSRKSKSSSSSSKPSFFSKSKASAEEERETPSSSYSGYSPSKSSAPVTTTSSVSAPVPALDEQSKQALLGSFNHGADKTGIDVVFSFDTTGSMYPCLEEVRTKLAEIATRLLKDIPNIRLAFIAHGDYCDQDQSYVIKALDFSTDVKALTSFVKEVGKTGGGDAPEAYELVLRDALSLSWDAQHSKALIVIGDEIPHPASYTDQGIFWKDYVRDLANAGIAVYGVQALSNAHATPFYSEIATSSGGFHLHLKDFALITEMFVAVCFRATSQEKFDEYQMMVESKGDVTPQMQQMLKEMEKPTEKKTFNIKDAWYDRQYDHGKPQYSWDAKAKKWVVCRK